jgi:hypothetical protein
LGPIPNPQSPLFYQINILLYLENQHLSDIILLIK